MYNALEACNEYIEQFGGHKYAAGLTLKEENYEDFKQAFERVVSNTIEKHMLTPEVTIDTEIPLDTITPKFYRILSQFAPFGPGNMTPVFMSTDLKDTGYGKCVGEEDKHLRFTVTQAFDSARGDTKLVGIGFGLGDKIDLISNRKPFKAAYSIDENHWNGEVSLQLKLRDIKA